MTAGIPPWRLWSCTRSEVICTMRATRRRSRQDHELAIFGAWRTATLVRARTIPTLSRLLRRRRRLDAATQAEIRSEVAALDAEFARLEAQAVRREAPDGR